VKEEEVNNEECIAVFIGGRGDKDEDVGIT
jgi:hypothetical protein